MDIQRQALSGAAQRRVVGDALRERAPQALAQGQGIREAPFQPPLRCDLLKEADQGHAEGDARGYGLLSGDRRGLVIGRAERLGVPIERGVA
jgi:hypothetical protein